MPFTVDPSIRSPMPQINTALPFRTPWKEEDDLVGTVPTREQQVDKVPPVFGKDASGQWGMQPGYTQERLIKEMNVPEMRKIPPWLEAITPAKPDWEYWQIKYLPPEDRGKAILQHLRFGAEVMGEGLSLLLPPARLMRLAMLGKAGIAGKAARTALLPVQALEEVIPQTVKAFGKVGGDVVEKMGRVFPEGFNDIDKIVIKSIPSFENVQPATQRQINRLWTIANKKKMVTLNKKGEQVFKRQLRVLAQRMTGKSNIGDMTVDEADYFIQAVHSLSARYGKPPRIPRKMAVIPLELADKLPYMKDIGFFKNLRQVPQVLRKIGLYEELWEPLQRAEVGAIKEMDDFVTKLKSLKSAIGDNPESKLRIFRALDGAIKIGDLTPSEKPVYDWFKTYFDQWANRVGLRASKRIKDYITHIFEKEVQDLIQSRHTLDPELLKALDYTAPKKMFNRFLQERLGAKSGLVEDPFRAAEVYQQVMTRYYYYQPLVKKLAAYEPLVREYAPISADYLQKLASRLTGRPTIEDKAMNNTLKELGEYLGKLPGGERLATILGKDTANPSALIAHNYSGILFTAWLGFRPTSAIRNLSQQLLAVIEAGPKSFGTALGNRGTVEAKSVLKESLVLASRKQAFVPGFEIAELSSYTRVAQKYGLAMFKFADRINVENAFLSGYYKGKSLGLDRTWAVKMGDEVALNTQYLYTRMARSLFEETSVGRFLTPFTSWPRNWMELMAKWTTGRQSEVLLQYSKATGKSVGLSENWAWRHKEFMAYLALVTAAFGVERGTNFKAQNYVGVTSWKSLADFASGDIPSLEIIGSLASLVGSMPDAASGDMKSMKAAWTRLRPDKQILIINQLTNIIQGKQDWLTLFLYMKQDKQKKRVPWMR